MSRLSKHYKENVTKSMMAKYKYDNVNMVPKVQKIVVNCTTKDCVVNGKIVNNIMDDLAAITGQKPVVAKSKKSIAQFKLRTGQAIGAFVTLRGERMYEFLDRLISLSLPRVRDFRGVDPKCFDGRGNYTLGLKEQIIFPEIDYDKIDKVRGLGISIITTATNNEEGRELLTQMGMPFREK
ncbi:MAG: 50S ribosomal protein L5 [Bdellovibrionales bacterium RIFOXYD12_FULL_39_22]|nr:MAG: 50S ribosomal protein L5 [Bdellovibrionales bacterium RIFOXYB1_FULL_39_21]OFZ43396.1 MAG: 50S ribosomal protein L5 [Bdellovibrionales bacterium RIFOXYC12_FULL_39_17]OFZ47424.1 MAG: 50S ribosomal protein L5 [Bdellovibrionales bacterium RIFOXYC1_FULL_39_130]OFZ73853.1 MAG: 50S ribosomal protein L5 [Bdellovibrionales bacterium RIFOXYC2_FULL_39_8]OFZ76304.1 MAG: 50S ribosomal protein L5 [Bdellovibrionales bacterium RIFOXYD1_FULL_39_84]OFZ94342.1 MAG: 50S ribosomal protein L5 [Bdellovibrion